MSNYARSAILSSKSEKRSISIELGNAKTGKRLEARTARP